MITFLTFQLFIYDFGVRYCPLHKINPIKINTYNMISQKDISKLIINILKDLTFSFFVNKINHFHGV